MQVDVHNTSIEKIGTVDLPDAIFAADPKPALLWEQVRAQRASARRGTQKTKNRAEVSGTGSKPYRQKGTGNARAGTRRSNIRRGGGRAFAKRPRDWSYRLPKKALRLATRMAMASRIADNEVTLIDELKFEEPRTAQMASILTALAGAGQMACLTEGLLRKKIEARKRAEAWERRSQRLESIGTLAGGIAHDLNNVLTPIMMGAKLLARSRPESSRQGLIETILASAERGAGMIRQLLAFAGGVEGKRESLQFRDIIDEVRAILDHTLPKTIMVEVNIPEDLRAISGDATELSQVLMNLCINARDAMPEGGNLTFSAENVVLDGKSPPTSPDLQPGPYLLMSIVDTGTGIPPQVIDQVFDPFFTTKAQGSGTGLGLSTSLGIVRGHGGTINVYSEQDKGTKFAIYLPAERSEKTRVAEERQRELPQGDGELVLLVDDEVLILEMARATLEAYGYRVLTAAGGAKALATYQQHRDEVQVVVLDMMMPEMDGPATMKALRSMDPQVCVVASSGF